MSRLDRDLLEFETTRAALELTDAETRTQRVLVRAESKYLHCIASASRDPALARSMAKELACLLVGPIYSAVMCFALLHGPQIDSLYVLCANKDTSRNRGSVLQ